jgi:Zn-dependent peptidase ImmA (M78 family)
LYKRKDAPSEEEIARGYRRNLGIDHLQWLDPMTILNKLRHEFGFNFATVAAEDIAPAPAQWDFDAKLIRIADETFAAANFPRSDGHARFSIFHEIIHALSGHEGKFNRLHSRSEIPRYARGLRALESRNDKITAAFMAPRHLISEAWTSGKIASSFGMSPESARIRIEEIKGRSRAARRLPDSVAQLLIDLNKSSHD